MEVESKGREPSVTKLAEGEVGSLYCHSITLSNTLRAAVYSLTWLSLQPSCRADNTRPVSESLIE